MSLKEKLAGPQIVLAPGIYDMISLKLADRLGFDCLYMTGFGTVSSHLGLPDIGLATFSDMLERVRVFCGATSTPILCDGDAGFGGLVNVAHAVKSYERAGAAGIQLDDREVPRLSAPGRGQRVTSVEAMERKLKVALDTRTRDDFLIIARTYARTSIGLDEALRRCERYARLGADILFVQSPESTDEIEIIGSAFDTPTLVDMFEGLPTPDLSPARLKELGYAIVIYPGTGFSAAAHALARTYASIWEGRGISDVLGETYPISELRNLLGYEAIRAFDEKYDELGN